MTGTLLLKEPVAGTRGVTELNSNPGTLGIVKASTTPILQLWVRRRGNKIKGRTHATHNPNKNQAVNFLVKYRPHMPRSPRLHSFHFSACRSRRSSLEIFPVNSLSSDAFHSGPNVGTVTISTCPSCAPSGRLTSLGGAGESTGWYLNAAVRITTSEDSRRERTQRRRR